MRIDDLKVFVQVAQSGSLHRAAERVRMTQSALSKALARLEAEFEVRLFERTARGVALTPVGQTLLARANRILVATDDFEEEVKSQQSARAGRVRLGTAPQIVSWMLARAVGHFLDRRPGAVFSLDTHLSDDLLERLQAGEVDFACCGIPGKVPLGLEHASLQTLVLQIVARSGHPRLRSWHTLADLSNERWVLAQAASSMHRAIAAPLATSRLPPPRVAFEWTGSGMSISELVRNSDMLGLLPQHLLAQPEGRGLRAVGEPGWLQQPEIGLFWRSDGYLSPLCVEFRDAVIASWRSA